MDVLNTIFLFMIVPLLFVIIVVWIWAEWNSHRESDRREYDKVEFITDNIDKNVYHVYVHGVHVGFYFPKTHHLQPMIHRIIPSKKVSGFYRRCFNYKQKHPKR